MARIEPITAAAFVPKGAGFGELTEAARRCKGCDLYKDATQTVFGEGALEARVMLVGEAPGNVEDKKGRPFVGPAGGLLKRALEEAGLDRGEVYITNAVKHFRFLKTGHYRYHRNPSGLQIRACRPWLDAEIELVRPQVIVCLGAVAARSLLERAVTLKNERGRFFEHRGHTLFFTIHPSALLRMEDSREEEYRRFVADLRQVRGWLERAAKKAA